MLQPNSIKILQSITNITNSAIISYPITTITNDTSDVLANIDFSKLEEPFDEYGIMDLGSFLGAVMILDEPTLSLEDSVIVAKDKDSEISFVTSYPSSLEEFTTNPLNITTTMDAPSQVDIPVDVALFNKIRKGASVFKTLKDLFIVKNADGIYLKTGNKESFASRDNSYKLKLEASKNEGDDFEVVIPVDNFLALPPMEYMMKIKYNEKQRTHRVTLENEIFSFVLSIRV